MQCPALFDSMPFWDATPAARGGGMLGDEYRMGSEWGLFAVLFGKIRRNSSIHKLICVLFDKV